MKYTGISDTVAYGPYLQNRPYLAYRDLFDSINVSSHSAIKNMFLFRG